MCIFISIFSFYNLISFEKSNTRSVKKPEIWAIHTLKKVLKNASLCQINARKLFLSSMSMFLWHFSIWLCFTFCFFLPLALFKGKVLKVKKNKGKSAKGKKKAKGKVPKEKVKGTLTHCARTEKNANLFWLGIATNKSLQWKTF